MKSYVTSVMVVLAMFVVSVSSAFAAGGGVDQTWLNSSFDLGDINGGFQTSSSDKGTSLYANIGGLNKITNANISLYPHYFYSYDADWNQISRTLDGYEIQASFGGYIMPLTTNDIGYQSQSSSFNARGIYIYQSIYR